MTRLNELIKLLLLYLELSSKETKLRSAVNSLIVLISTLGFSSLFRPLTIETPAQIYTRTFISNNIRVCAAAQRAAAVLLPKSFNQIHFFTDQNEHNKNHLSKK